MIATRLASSLEIKSKYLRRYLVSISVRPCHFSGKNLIDLHKSVHSKTSTVTSPVLVLNRGPLTPNQSPISISERFSYESSILFLRNRTCNLPYPSCKSKKTAFPILLRLTILPTTETFSDLKCSCC